MTLETWYSKCGPWTSSANITWELLEMQNPRPYPRPSESEPASDWYVHMKVGEVLAKTNVKRKEKNQ